ncbi:RCC1 domain-containing protein [Leucobacter luti]|uniref:RCC1 domain-containing protein n=1 Tax=Leucobacter luti TaxID=340320 RepID=UPI0032607F3E
MFGALLLPTAAYAVPTPNAGPVAGATIVTDSVPTISFTKLAANYSHSVAIGTDGNAYGWGDNSYGQLGDGTTSSSTTPVKVSAPDGVTFVDIAAGAFFTIATGSDDKTYAWGYNSTGQLGNGTLTNSPIPVEVLTPASVTFSRLGAGVGFAGAEGSDGNIYMWGDNSNGQLGTGTFANTATPAALVPPVDVTLNQIAVGPANTFAIGSDGNSYGWGNNAYGQLGDGTLSVRNTPTPIVAPSGVTFTAFAPGDATSAAIGSDGNTYAWGDNASGGLGNGTVASSFIPTQVSAPTGVTFTTVSSGNQFTVATGSDGNTYAWGDNVNGQLGDDTDTNSAVPVRVLAPAGVVFTQPVAGTIHALALGSDGQTYAWGYNEFGQLGDGTVANSWIPVPLLKDPVVTEVLFGAVPGTNLTQAGDAWTADTPGGCGVVDVTVHFTQFGQAHEIVTLNGFTYGSAPLMTVQPVSGTASTSGVFTAKAAATGDDTPTVQWQQAPNSSGPWTSVPNATAGTLTASVESTTSFRAVFTNCAGEVYSEIVTATVGRAPSEPGSGSGSNTSNLPSEPGAGSGSNTSYLASTGSSLIGGLAVAIVLLSLGFGAAVVGRRRRMRSLLTE